MKAVYVIVFIIAILALGIIFFPKTGKVSSNLPSYAMAHPMIKEAYEYAVNDSEALNGVNCYCGCMKHLHDGRIHKRGLLDCFMKEDGSFERHASQCDMCIKDALEVKKMMAQGKAKSEIKAWIDSKYR